MRADRRLIDMAREAGFDVAGLAPARPAPHADAFRAWLARGDHAGMAWLARDPAVRLDPRAWRPEARTLLLVAVSYFTEEPDPSAWNDPLRGRVARYAWGPDYHGVMEARLRALAERIGRDRGLDASGWGAFADRHPVFERAHAERAGLGFVGRNAQLIRPHAGSMFFLGGLVLPFAVEIASPVMPAPGVRCGRCGRCLDACPTGALREPFRIDARRCLSYLTIEHRGPIPEPLRPLLGRWVFGCDQCQTACPWVVRFSAPAQAPFLAWDPGRCAPRLPELLAMDEAAFNARYGETPVARARLRGMRRNAAIALGNSGVPDALPALDAAADDPDPVVAETARWAREHVRVTSE